MPSEDAWGTWVRQCHPLWRPPCGDDKKCAVWIEGMLRLRRGQNRFSLGQRDRTRRASLMLWSSICLGKMNSRHTLWMLWCFPASQTQNWKAKIQVLWFREGLSCLWIDLADTVRRPCVMKSTPRFLKGAFRDALQTAIDAANSSDESVAQRG